MKSSDQRILSIKNQGYARTGTITWNLHMIKFSVEDEEHGADGPRYSLHFRPAACRFHVIGGDPAAESTLSCRNNRPSRSPGRSYATQHEHEQRNVGVHQRRAAREAAA